jgi:hypothetical protein
LAEGEEFFTCSNALFAAISRSSVGSG